MNPSLDMLLVIVVWFTIICCIVNTVLKLILIVVRVVQLEMLINMKEGKRNES